MFIKKIQPHTRYGKTIYICYNINVLNYPSFILKRDYQDFFIFYDRFAQLFPGNLIFLRRTMPHAKKLYFFAHNTLNLLFIIKKLAQKTLFTGTIARFHRRKELDLSAVAHRAPAPAIPLSRAVIIR